MFSTGPLTSSSIAGGGEGVADQEYAEGENSDSEDEDEDSEYNYISPLSWLSNPVGEPEANELNEIALFFLRFGVFPLLPDLSWKCRR